MPKKILGRILSNFLRRSILFRKLEREGSLQNSYKASVTLITKPGKHINKNRKLQAVSPVNINVKILNKILAN